MCDFTCIVVPAVVLRFVGIAASNKVPRTCSRFFFLSFPVVVSSSFHRLVANGVFSLYRPFICLVKVELVDYKGDNRVAKVFHLSKRHIERTFSRELKIMKELKKSPRIVQVYGKDTARQDGKVGPIRRQFHLGV